MPTCREVSRAVATGEIERAGLWRRLRIRLHLMMCRHCRRYAAQLRALGEAARRSFGRETDDPERIARLRDAVLRHDRKTRDEDSRPDPGGPP